MSLSEDYDYLFKIMLIGDSGVGKSSLMMRICDEKFNPTFFPTIGVDFKIKTFYQNSESIKMQIWDTAGQERFKSITNAYYRGAHGIIIVFDLTNRESFKDVEIWLADIEKLNNSSVVRIMVGNKCDLDETRQVRNEEAQRFADSMGLKYIETSAKSDKNVQKTLMSLNDEMKKEFFKGNNQSQKKNEEKISKLEKNLKGVDQLTRNACKC